MTKDKIAIFACVCLLIIFLAVEVYSRKTPAEIEKVATVNLSTGGAIEVIGIKHRGHQCYLVVGQSSTRLINMKADLVCP